MKERLYSYVDLGFDFTDDETVVDPPFVDPELDERPTEEHPTLVFRRDDYFGATVVCAVPPLPRGR